MTGFIGVDSKLANEATFDMPRFFFRSGSEDKETSREHTLTESPSSLRFLFRYENLKERLLDHKN